MVGGGWYLPVVPDEVLVGGEVYGVDVRTLAEELAMNAGSESRVVARCVTCERRKGAFNSSALALEGRSTGNDLGGAPKKARS